MTPTVLHLIKGLGPGGAERLLVNQARAGAGSAVTHRVAYLVPWKNQLVPELEAAGWATTCLGTGRAWDLRWARRFRRLVLDSDVGVVHGHSPLVSSIARLVLATLPDENRPATLYTEHNEWGRHRRLTRWLNRRTIGREDQVLAVSTGVRDSMPPHLDVHVVRHGIDVAAVAAQAAHREAVRAELGVEADGFVVGIVANLRREKRYDVLLDAAARVVAADHRVRFVSVGQGPLEDEIGARHRRLGLGDRFSLLGYRDDATRVMSAFDLFTLTSDHEGLPVALMEAVALGLPVVATRVGGVAEALVGTDAVLVDPGDVGALADAYLAAAAGQIQARRADPSRFDAGAAATELDRRYRELAGQVGRARR